MGGEYRVRNSVLKRTILYSMISHWSNLKWICLARYYCKLRLPYIAVSVINQGRMRSTMFEVLIIKCCSIDVNKGAHFKPVFRVRVMATTPKSHCYSLRTFLNRLYDKDIYLWRCVIQVCPYFSQGWSFKCLPRIHTRPELYKSSLYLLIDGLTPSAPRPSAGTMLNENWYVILHIWFTLWS